MSKLTLNTLSKEVFEVSGEFDAKVVCNGKEISRNDLIGTGRLLACEYIGGKLNQRPTADKYVSRLNEKCDYASLSKQYSDKLFMFCATTAYKAVGKDAPASAEKAKRDLSLAKNKTFLATLAAIAQDVIRPLIFRVYDDVSAGGLMQWEAVPFGGTKAIDIKSNDVFLFEDSSFGAGRSASFNTLYGKTLTLNPTAHTAQTKIKWYQDVVNGDVGYFFAAIMSGLYNKYYAKFIQALTAAAANTKYIPTGLTASTYTTSNWNTLTTKVAAVNGVDRTDLVAFGGINQLAKVIPTDGLGAAITGLQYGLGEEWFRRGYLPNAAGVQLLETQPVVVPHTQNSTIDMIGTGTNIFIAAKAGYGYAPIYGGYYEGTPLTVELTPDITADFTIDTTVTAMFDMKPVFASKVGVITNVA